MFRAVEPLLAREADGRAFRLVGMGIHDLVEVDQIVQGDLFGGIGSADSKMDEALDAVRDRFGDDAHRQGPRLGYDARAARAFQGGVSWTGTEPRGSRYLRRPN